MLARKQTKRLNPTKDSVWEDVLANIARAMGPVTAAVLGLPYHGEVAKISAQQTEVAAQLFGAGSRVKNEVAMAFDGAFIGADGVLALSGTGSMPWSRGPMGVHRVDGWGNTFEDERSGF